MAQDNWEGDYSSYVDVTSPNRGSSAFTLDWVRELNHLDTSVDGVLLTDIAPGYNNFATEADVVTFLNEQILHKINFRNTAEKEAAINYLKLTFHQGGYLAPASSAIALSMFEKRTVNVWMGARKNRKEVPTETVLAFATVNNPHKVLTISTSPSGLTIQEVSTVERLVIAFDHRVQNELDDFFEPDAGNEFVLKSKAIVTIDFTTTAAKIGEPNVVAEHNSISYGNAYLKNLIHQTLMYKLFVFKSELSKLKHSEVKAIQDLWKEGIKLLKLIEPNVNTRDVTVYVEVNNALDCLIAALNTPNSQTEARRDNAHKLALLSKEVSGHESPVLKMLGAGLLVFAGLALVAGGVLAVIPTGGASLLAVILAAVGGEMGAVAFGSTVSVAASVGFGFFRASHATGLARSLTKFNETYVSAGDDLVVPDVPVLAPPVLRQPSLDSDDSDAGYAGSEPKEGHVPGTPDSNSNSMSSGSLT